MFKWIYLFRFLCGFLMILFASAFMRGESDALEAPIIHPRSHVVRGVDHGIMAEKTMAVPSAVDAVLPWRGTLLGADHGPGPVHHDNVYVQINDGPIIYYTTIPARKEGNLLPDFGLLWHLFSRDQTTYPLRVDSSTVDGTLSPLSVPLTIFYDFDTNGCTEQTVPIADAGPDQIVQTNTEVTLDGSGSYDPYGPDTAGLFYAWECYAAPVASLDLSSNADSPIATFKPTTPGNYYFRFSVRDRFEGGRYNRSPVSYMRVSVVDDPSDPDLMNANAGVPQEVTVADNVILDGSRSVGPNGTTYSWEQTNPLGNADVQNMAEVFGSVNCNGSCYKVNYNADGNVDGQDVAILANNMGAVNLINGDQAEARFIAGIARPHIFRLTISDGIHSASETTMVAVHHPNVNEVLTPVEVDSGCLVP